VRRRAFISLLGGAAASWPLAARAQQGDRMRRVGVLMASAADDSENQARMAAFLQGLAQLVDTRWGAIMVEDGTAALLRQPAPHWPSADR
jgi:putative ABC transport system substrate-binding protein